jgi:predicted outer membrane repeat protein
MSIMTNATTYGCDFINNSAVENGGAVCTALDCRFGFFSDKETGKAGTMKNNSAGELGGGFYQGKNAPFAFGGEIYASGNVSSAGNDDIRIRYGFACDLRESIISPDGSIGIYYEDDDGGQLAEWIDGSITVNSAAFFFNNGEFECKFNQGHVKTMMDGKTYDGIMYTLDLVKKTAPIASIFGEGSLTMIVALAALIASVAAIVVNVTNSKKKTVPADAGAADNE